MEVVRSITVAAPRGDVFALVSDPNRYPEFFRGVTRWKPLSDRAGIGARYRVLMQIGSIEAGGVVRVVSWSEPATIAWESETGIRQRGSWRLKDEPAGTRVTLEVEYSLSGGPAGSLVERMTARIVGRHLWATLLAARRLIERERRAPKLHA